MDRKCESSSLNEQIISRSIIMLEMLELVPSVQKAVSGKGKNKKFFFKFLYLDCQSPLLQKLGNFLALEVFDELKNEISKLISETARFSEGMTRRTVLARIFFLF